MCLPGKATERSSPRAVAPCRQEREGAHMPTVISVFNSSQLGSPDPSGLAYSPVASGLFLVDSEVDETPFFSSTNLFALTFGGGLQQSYNFSSVSTEPTGVAFDPTTGRLYVSDDDSNRDRKSTRLNSSH